MGKKLINILGLVISVILIGGFFLFFGKVFNRIPAKNASGITIYWVNWPGADALKELVKDFTAETGIRVSMVTADWPVYQKTLFQELDNKSSKFDLAIGDSQWLGKGIQNGHYIEITDWAREHHMEAIMIDSTIKAFSEYPKGSGKFWAVPVAGEAVGFAYRQDLFEDQGEKALFKAKYGYELAVPETSSQLKDIAEFFTRPKKDLYGISIMTNAKDYDGLTMAMDALIWSWGSTLGDYNNFRVQGVLNSPEGIEALKFYKQLYVYNPPGWVAGLGDGNQAFKKGRVAMVMDFFGLFPALIDPKFSPYAQQTGFFKMPKGPGGERFTSIGGQGISLVSYSKNKENAFKFLEWWLRDDVQHKWGQIGGQSCSKKVIYSREFQSVKKYYPDYADSLVLARDFWAVPEYEELLGLSQQIWAECVLEDSLSPDQAMNKLAQEWERIFEFAGYYKE